MSAREWLAANRVGMIAMGIFVSLVLVGAGFLAYTGLRTNLLRDGSFRLQPAVVEPSGDPFTTLPLYVDPHSQTVAAAAADSRFDALARVAQAKWFSDWSTTDTIASDLGTYLAGATARHELPVAVFYRIPSRDCGGYAEGGARDDSEYRTWVDRAASAVQGRPLVVVLEPDSIGMLGRCSDPGAQAALLGYAVHALARAGVWVYLDGGHSDWQSPEVMAKRLKQADVAEARGFATNVANYRPTADELDYGMQVSTALTTLGVKDKRFVVDTGRNGAPVAKGGWCNPKGARIGRAPALVFDGLNDGFLWIKDPGETDGTCRGGPPSGFWDELALMLLGQPSRLD
ncbi:glycoside hydrolase family 6 protein [Nocardioides sp. Kera G14]|uniref:glycoside hydrolase family 6 protein n=1 Tax=Nocardioides sp. Kera G14 TaxID=2884264 RepID=UPI001D123E36|nr:glycoside hydrolase family 6 protein [Nocardioides sp. Kera G14]UDY24925.1 glycoside hydrolase family 6 protein [Nocardioides sp. Kera G14]